MESRCNHTLTENLSQAALAEQRSTYSPWGGAGPSSRKEQPFGSSFTSTFAKDDEDVKPDVASLRRASTYSAMSVDDDNFDHQNHGMPMGQDDGLYQGGGALQRAAPMPKGDPRKYTLYHVPEEIVYTPEAALREGHAFVS